MLDLSRLSPAQRDAVLVADRPLLILAGPGSGKTTVLAARIAYLVTARGIPPTSVLALTFSTKATRELRARLGGLLGAAARSVDVTTFHALGLRIVRQWSEAIGWGTGPLAVYGDGEARRVLREVTGELGFDPKRLPLRHLAARLERYRLEGEPAVGHTAQLAAFAERYEALLRRRGAVDYPAMLSLPLRLFAARHEALRLLQDSYRHVLCDEFQDVCAAQYRLLKLLAERHRNLVVVGDPLQTLYGWRGADSRFLLEFERDFPEARVIGLDQNFRATGRLVDLANTLGAPLPYGRRLWTDNPPGELARLHAADDDGAEAAFVAAEIARLCADGRVAHPGEVGVLYRTNQQVHRLALALREHRLPYRVRGAGDLFARREVRDAVAYLRLAHSADDGAALARIVNTPPRRLGRLAAALRTSSARAGELPSLARPHGPAAIAGAEALLTLVDELHARGRELPPAPLLDLILDRSGYRVWLEGLPDGAARLRHLAALRDLAEHAEGDLGTWLADLQLGEDVAAGPDEAERVVLTTIHGAKGGEWRVVFVVGLEEGLLPHAHALLADPAARDGVEAERRVAYVAVTRPREGLYLLYTRSRRRGDQSEPRRPSRFLRGLSLDLIERAA
ncbi:MAG: ATP-dependent helicase [Dehalococcoidia bacterium]